ncbi:MAG: hypothetical protein OEZ37_08135, partial [Gemmatimonadota bacterium]|nr:hypothetical protein [Gemmatimonadota bacterium]
MRSTSRITAAVLAFFVACTTLPPDSEQPTVESVYAMVDSFHVAFAAEDSARLGRLISEDSTMTFYGTSLSEMQRGQSEFLVKHPEQDWAQVDD